MKQYLKENKKMVLNALLSLVVIILILTIFLVIYVNKETKLESFNNTVLATIENALTLDIDDEYVLVEFPDNKEIISNNGKIKGKLKKYNEFTKGYIIVYKDKTYAFKLSNNSYCASKKYNELDVNIDIYGECENYEIEYKKTN